ncbi:MAG: DUF2281 domain-containing protein [Defluviitaleaceae bacterium]|nr:DUF2281 domain-containing protein [Defluviitaleaceae bacterium]
MQSAKQTIYSLIDTLPPSQLSEVASFITFIKMRDENKLFKDMEALSMSSTDFWDNEIDDEVWNDV